MAIIYTYPRVINPDGTELIVVSETKNKNATRIMYVQDIWDHFDCSHCDFCTTSISEITSPFGDTVTALACDTGINFTSSDASVTITGDNLTNTIDFKSAGGGGGCPPNYVIKPVTCEEGECLVSTKLAEWVWTCDETLGALAPDYIDNLTLNGTSVPHPSSDLGDTCWYIEAVTLSASAATCETCCTPGETAYKLSPCDPELTKYYTTEAFTPGIGGFVGLVVLATTPEGTLCYVVSEEAGDPPIAVVIGAVQESCDAPACTDVTPTYTWENCSTSVQFTTEEFIPAAVVGKVYEYCCTGGDTTVTECFEYLGDIGEPAGGTPPCNPLVSAIFIHDDCECCLYKCVYEYTACPGNPTSLPNTVYFEMPLLDSEPNPCDCTAPHPNPVFTDDISGDTWCYEVGDQICVPPTGGVSFVADPHYCEDEDYCPTPPEVTYTFTNCTDPGASFSTLESNITIPGGYTIGDWADTACTYATINLGVGELFCYEVTTGGVSSGIAIEITQDPVVLDPLLGDCCDCCIYPCTYEYVLPCDPDDRPDEAPVTVTVEIPDCADSGVPNVVSVEYSAGEFWCYQSPVKTCVIPIDTLYASGDDCTLCDVVDYYAWKNCDEEDFNYTTEDIQTLYPDLYTQLPFTGPFGNQMSTDCWDPQCCFTVEGPFPGPIPGADVPLPNDGTCDDPNNAELAQECDCCIYWDVVEYAACSEDCELEAYPLLNINVCEWGKSLLVPEDWKWDTAPTFVKVQTPSGECCYEKREQPCAAETLISDAGLTYSDLDWDETWSDCTCGVVGVKLNLCDAVDPVPPIWASDTLSPGISALNVGDIVSHAGTCYEVIESPAPLLGPISNLAGFVFWDSEPPLDPCECCNVSAGTNNRQYLACVDGDPSIVINPGSWSPPLTTFGIDTDIRVEYASNPGVWHCYIYDQCISSSVTLGISDIQISTTCTDSLCDLNLVELTQCGGAYTETLSKTEIVTGGLVNGDIINITGGPLSGIGITTCWEITNINAPGPQTQVGVSTYTGPIAASGIDATTACQCCEQDLREYTICDGAAGVTCNALAPTSLLIDVSSIAGYDPATYGTVVAEEISSSIQCCYTYNGPAECQAPTGTIISTAENCEDVECNLL